MTTILNIQATVDGDEHDDEDEHDEGHDVDEDEDQSGEVHQFQEVKMSMRMMEKTMVKITMILMTTMKLVRAGPKVPGCEDDGGCVEVDQVNRG